MLKIEQTNETSKIEEKQKSVADKPNCSVSQSNLTWNSGFQTDVLATASKTQNYVPVTSRPNTQVVAEAATTCSWRVLPVPDLSEVGVQDFATVNLALVFGALLKCSLVVKETRRPTITVIAG